MTQDEIIEMARQAGLNDEVLVPWSFEIQAFAKLVEEHAAAKEREACAKTVETIKAYRELEKVCFKFAAKTIRARGQA